MGIYDNPELKKYEETLQSLAGQKILNLGGKTNTDLKLEYGVANLETLCACDENYTTLCRTIYEYAECLKKLGHDAEAVGFSSTASAAGPITVGTTGCSQTII